MASSLNDILLAHQISTIKHAAGLGQSVVPYLNEMKAIIRKKVAGFDAEKRTAKRLETMLNTLANTLNKPAGAWLAELEKSLKEFAKYEAAYQSDTIGSWVGVNFTEPTIGQVWAAAQFQPLALSTSPIDFGKMMDDWGVDEVNRLVMGCKQGFVEGLTTRQIIKNVVGDGGLADISLRNAKAVANTAMMHVATSARMAVMEENDDVVIGYEWVSTLDGRTSPICQFRDSQVFLFTDKVQPKPPAHYNCRSSVAPKLSPEFDIFDEGATRASKGDDGGKQVSADLTYYSWLKQQPAAYQDDILGKTKGAIFRNAGLDAKEFRKITVDDLGRPLTIDEMKAADKRVASYLSSR
jgi:SPP1 gp7 family putative phage head morphogenesis protein